MIQKSQNWENFVCRKIQKIQIESDERNWMDMIDDKKSYERDHMVESKEDNLESKESVTDERDKIENPE